MSRRPNQVSLKDLFTTNPGELLGARYASDSALDSASQGNSQFLYSQAEFFDSQDGQQLPHSQNLSQSPTTRFFNRYMAKGSVIGRDSSQSQIGRSYSAPIAPKLPNQQQIQLLKARTQEHDERDLWNTLVSGIRECSAEVRVAVACLKESTQLGIGSTECQLMTFIEKIQSGLEKSQSAIVETLSNQDNARTKETELQQQLAIKNARIEELERQIEKMSQEKQNVTITSLRSTCEDLCHKISESLESFFCRSQNALTRLDVVQAKNNEFAVDQMKQYLQQHFQDQKEYMKSFIDGYKTFTNLQNETAQMQSGILTSEILESLHIVQEDQLKGFEGLLIHQIRELLEKKELNQKAFFEEQYQRFSVIQQEQRHEVLNSLQSEIQNSCSEQKKEFLNIIEDCMSQEKNRCIQLLKELENVNSVNERRVKKLEDDKDPVSSESLSRGRIDVVSPELMKYMKKNDFPKERQPEEGIQIRPIHWKTQPDTPCVQPTKRMECDGDTRNLPSSAASLNEFLIDPAPRALSSVQYNSVKGPAYREAMEQSNPMSSNSGTRYKGDRPVNRGKLEMTEALDPNLVSPLPSGNARSRNFSSHYSYVAKYSKVNPSPVALVIPQVQAPKPLQVDRNSRLLVNSVVQSTAVTPAHPVGTTKMFSEVKSGSFATPVLITGTLREASIARAKAPTMSEVQPSSTSHISAFSNVPIPEATSSSMKTPITKELICNYKMQQPNSPAKPLRKVSKKRRGKGSRTSQSRKRARKQPVVEISIPDKHSTGDNKKLVTKSSVKPDKITAKKLNHKQSAVCKVESPMDKVFDFHSDTSVESDDDFPVNNKRSLNFEAQLSTYSRVSLEGRRITRSSFDISKRHIAPKIPDLSETSTKAGNHGLYSLCSKFSTVGGLPASHKEKCNSVDLENNCCLEKNPSSKEGYCSSSASSSPCWSIGDILKLSEA